MKAWAIITCLSILAACATPSPDSSNDPEVGLAVTCKGDRIEKLALSFSGTGSLILPVEALAKAYCRGA